MKRRIVITGRGAITPLGHSVDESFAAQIAGRSGVAAITLFDASTFPTTFAAEVKGFDVGSYVDAPERFQDSGTNTRFALAAAGQALDDAGLQELHGVDPTRFGVYMGTGEGVLDFHCMLSMTARSYRGDRRQVDTAMLTRIAMAEYCPEREYELELHTTPAHLAEEFGLEGPNFNCLTACAAGSQAIGEAAQMIRRGDADVMMAGGSHSMIHPLGLMGFNLLTALSTRNDQPCRASRPFDLHRDGFVLGEGAGILILEELEHARRRRARIYAELTGYGVTADAYRVTDSHPDGRGAALCMRAALADACLDTADIGYINAHGTSTRVNDRSETIAIKKVFAGAAYQIPISSTKSMLGHMIAAAGPVELITCIESMRRGILPPTINYETPDPECDLDYIPNTARPGNPRHALSNSFGFGGQNVTLIVSQFAE